MRKVLLLILFLAIYQPYNFAQNKESVIVCNLCPDIKVNVEKEFVFVNDIIVARVDYSFPDSTKLKHNWTVDNGEIIEGQGAPLIKIKPDAEFEGLYINITVSLIGIDPSCNNKASQVVQFISPRPLHPIDSYEKLSKLDEQARLDNIAVNMNMDENSKCLFQLFIKSRTKQKGINLQIKRILKHLILTRKIKATRLLFSISEGNQELVIAFIIPTEANFPSMPEKFQLLKGKDLAKRFGYLKQK